MAKIKQATYSPWVRSLAALAMTTALTGCVTQPGMRGKMSEMHEHPMHWMMQDLGCMNEPTGKHAGKEMSPDQMRAHMQAHADKCKAKLRQTALDEVMALVERCIDKQLGRHANHGRRKYSQAGVTAQIRACAREHLMSADEPSEPGAHDH